MKLTVTNKNGVRASWFSRGGTLAELHVPDAAGELADVVLGFDEEADYETGANQHFGCITGRYANRIAKGQFTLDGQSYQLAVNHGPHHLHGGGERSLDRVDWAATKIETDQGSGVRFEYTSPDGEENYPGTLACVVTYVLTDDNGIHIEYFARTDAPTPVNLTNHSYFNLSGHGAETVLDHLLRIDADRYTVTDELLIPTGEIASVDNTPLDFRTMQLLGARLADVPGGYDHNYVLNGPAGDLREVAKLVDPHSGRTMTVSTDQPGMQLYIASGLGGQAGKLGKTYQKHSAVCLETQHFPDSPNRPEFPSTILRPGESYRHVCIYKFGIQA